MQRPYTQSMKPHPRDSSSQDSIAILYLLVGPALIAIGLIVLLACL
jgi:hypothetical protein